MDKNLAKDNLSDSLEAFKAFVDFSRNEQQSIHEYIAMFDAKYRKKKKKNDPPPEILASKLLRKTNITKEEKLLVLTGMNNKNWQTLYKEAEQSLKKFKSNMIHEKKKAISLELAFFIEKQEALLGSGLVRKSTQQREGNFRSIGSNFRVPTFQSS